ncbi:type ISP restriction/modification enzyme [Streptomyces cyaneofuscatus]|uniref:DNA methyltransferase n=1 Tax=Streptomyces cyaneofuscatus TaxID=66883 RepID=A0ABZ1F583_9ACTN|nr:type ISP restriction/modification enzyme [Streptomyces cyaneofuscatus]WSB11459.1 DNA methyltransferase [Streptomyces cyaneofuscatus]WSD45007.1 DNA methyltransferase [Streptomyces cyaneofuscatus]WTA88202.1 DNA methyltransferase [Streptomyces cyaneofuscatus]
MHYRSVAGTRDEKFLQLRGIRPDDEAWRETHAEGADPFTPLTSSGWQDFPALNDLLPWGSPGIKANRSWASSPSKETLRRRWARLVRESDPATKSVLFKETRDRTLTSTADALPGLPARTGTVRDETDTRPALACVSLRSFDRQWLISDNRVLDYPRPSLWASADSVQQLFLNQQSSHEIDSGPAVVATHLLPDTHHFNGRGGRVMPLLHPDGSPNVAPGLLAHLTCSLGAGPVGATDLAAYIAGVTGHSAFTEHFAEELLTPGVRLPLTKDPELWHRATVLGAEMLWASTYGARLIDPAAGRPAGDVRFPKGDDRQVRYLSNIGHGVPDHMRFEAETQTLSLGEGAFAPVPAAVWSYHVGGMKVVNKWFGYRKAKPTSKKTSPLDDLHVESWPTEWTEELIELLSVLRRITDLAAAQRDLLADILAGPAFTRDELSAAGVLFAREADRKPRHRPVGTLFTDLEGT